MTVQEAALYLGVPPHTLERWAWDGVGPRSIGQRRHNNVQYDQKDLDAWLQENRSSVSNMIGVADPVWPAPRSPKRRAGAS